MIKTAIELTTKLTTKDRMDTSRWAQEPLENLIVSFVGCVSDACPRTGFSRIRRAAIRDRPVITIESHD